MKTDYSSFQLVETDLKSPNKIGYICTYQKVKFIILQQIIITHNIYETMRVDEGYPLRKFTGQMGNLIGQFRFEAPS
ncbi:hypothetical protein T07_2473 [Trichinella nelsoni]|uniref:Uncharacterized protein n=1 Tax=Trichinella nelsoni TaxID=6336 RepID=A0A0V0REF6_9BILA|nr:hypothetical protein T07_2473 [Trichinella nelsoni]